MRYCCFFSRSKPVAPEALARATQALYHRGPDGQRQWISPSRQTGLGHARLSIIDLTTGDQPIASEDGRLSLVVNGEFYDFERIRRELEDQGCRFRTQSDSEIALHLYRLYGAQCVHRLRGEFAFAIWDEASQSLFAARDRFGIKPLFYAWWEDTLYMASEVKALFAAGVPARWDPDGFLQASHFATPHADRTLFAGVYQVPAGHSLKVSRGHFQLNRYWDFNYPAGPTEPLSDAEHIERFRHTLREAVRLRLRADVPVGCYLSGGLDSCAVLGLAAEQSRQPIRCFTIGFDQAEYDEAGIAREMAARTGSELDLLPLRHQDMAEHFSAAIRHCETLFFNPHGIAKYMLSKHVRKAGYKVVLTGEGSDEILAGYVHFRRDLLLQNQAGKDPAVLQAQLAKLAASNQVSRGFLRADGDVATIPAFQKTLGYTPAFFEAAFNAAGRIGSLMAPAFAATVAARDFWQEFLDTLDVPGQLHGRELVNQSLYLWSKLSLPNYILTVLGDRMEMAHSVEGRVPFLDHHVVEAARSLPVSLKIRDLTEKYVLREAVRDVISDTVYRRQKHPFLAPPLTSKTDEPLHQLLQDTLRGPELRSLPFYDARKVVALLDALPSMTDGERMAYDTPLMLILSACHLQRAYHLTL